MTDKESPGYYHARAAASASEARGKAMNLSAAGIAGLFALLTSEGFTADICQKILLISSSGFLAASIGSGVFNSYADAQWSFYRALLIDESRSDGSKPTERKWHLRKRISEYFTQIAFVVGVMLAAILLVSMIINIPNP